MATAMTMTVIAGCSSSGTSSGSKAAPPGVTTARDLVASAQAELHWKTPGPAIPVGASLRGKKVVVVTNGVDEFIRNVDDGLKQAGAAVGVSVVAENANSLADASLFIQQAVGQKASAIIINSWETSQLGAPIKAAAAAGIPVIQEFEHNPGPLTAVERAARVFANVSVCYSCGGRLMADEIVADSKGHADVLLINSPEIGTANLETAGFSAELKRLCPACRLKVDQVPIANWTTGLPSATASGLQSDSHLNYLAPVFDTMAPLMIPSVFAANAQHRVKLVGHSGDLAELKQMQSGSLPRWVADPGYDELWAGWATMDEVYRALLGKPALSDEQLKIRLFTPANIHSIDLSAPLSTWYGNVEYAAQYKKLWGIK
jgi:ABC-type sugar transport system substrate-binding protein